MGNDRYAHENGSMFCKEFTELVQLILDGEASSEHKGLFDTYMQCKHCVEYYQLESSSIQFLKSKLENNKIPVPQDLVNDIRSKISLMV